MPKTPRNNLAVDERREMIFRHASRVFAAKGYAGTKIADIAAAASMSQGLLYRHFESKEALFTELIRVSCERLNTAAEALEQMAIPPHEKIALAFDRLLAGMDADMVFTERVLLIAQASISEQVPEATKAVIVSERSKPYETMARIMAAGQAEGTILPGSPDRLSTLFWTTIKGLALHKLSLGAQFEAPEIPILLRMFLHSAKQQA